jgi:hypothetical protein
MDIDEVGSGHVVITFRRPAADIATFETSLREEMPVTLSVEVRAAKLETA